MITYSKGDRVKIKPIQWFNLQKDHSDKIRRGDIVFTKEMAVEMCNKVYNIDDVIDGVYVINEKYIASWAINDIDSSKLNGLPVPINNPNSSALGMPSNTVETESKPKEVDQVKKRPGRKPGSKNKPKEDKLFEEVKSTARKLIIGEVVIGWNSDDKSDFQMGQYDHSSKDGFAIVVAGELKMFKKLHVYTPEFLSEISKTIYERVSKKDEDLKKLLSDIQSMISEWESKYNSTLDRSLIK